MLICPAPVPMFMSLFEALVNICTEPLGLPGCPLAEIASGLVPVTFNERAWMNTDPPLKTPFAVTLRGVEPFHVIPGSELAPLVLPTLIEPPKLFPLALRSPLKVMLPDPLLVTVID